MTKIPSKVEYTFTYLIDGHKFSLPQLSLVDAMKQVYEFMQQQHIDSQTDPEELRQLLCESGFVVIRAGKTTADKLRYDLDQFEYFMRRLFWFAPDWLRNPR